MGRSRWYMLCYDIADNRRLGKVHRIMKKHGIAAQRSVFFVQGTEKEMSRLLDLISRELKPKEDDIRAYPVENPKKVWTTGGILEAFPLIMTGKGRRDPASSPKNPVYPYGKGFSD